MTVHRTAQTHGPRPAGEDPRRGSGPQQGCLCGARGSGRRHQRDPGALDRADGGRQVLASRHDRTQEPGCRRRTDRRGGWPEGLSGGDHGRVPRRHGPDLHCSSSPAQLGVRRLQGPQSRGGGAEGDLPGRGRDSRRGRSGRFRGRPLGPYAAIAPSWRRAWGEVVPFYAFPAEVRRLLYTTNAIEALNSKLRRAVRARGHFPTDEAALKLLFLVLNRSEKEWTMPAREWCMAKAQFAILFGERFTRAMA